jgi:transcriptional regulator with XRE-family HTH domain
MTLGDKIKQLRDEQKLMQREIGALIEVDAAFISKVEKNEKRLNRKHLSTLSLFFKIDEEILQTLWLADKIREIIKDEKLAKKATNIVLQELK